MAANEDVKSVAIDIQKGLVTITANYTFDPLTIVRAMSRTGKLARLQPMGYVAPAPVASAAFRDSVHQNIPSAASDPHCNKIDWTQNCVPGSSKVHFNEAAGAVPPVDVPYRHRLSLRPGSQFGGVGHDASRGLGRPMMEPLPQPLPPAMPPAMPPGNGYYRWSEPPPYYWQQQPPPAPAVAAAPGHYLFNDENVDACKII